MVKPTTTLSPRALQLILNHEVGGGEAYYNRTLSRPNWPGGASGVTIGIGYDLGYTPKERFLGDWHALSDEDRDKLGRCIGIKGQDAAWRAKAVRRDIIIPWALALAVFQSRTVPFWFQQTRKAFGPAADALPSDAFGALVSLVFNRGPALEGKRRQDMEDIFHILQDGVQCGDLALIAKELREMKTIWVGRGLPGLIRRREDEARLVEGAK